MEVKFCPYNPSSNFNIYLWNEVLLFQQLLHNHHARLLQLSKIATPCTNCDNLVTTLQSCSKVSTTHMGSYVFIYHNLILHKGLTSLSTDFPEW